MTDVCLYVYMCIINTVLSRTTVCVQLCTIITWEHVYTSY